MTDVTANRDSRRTSKPAPTTRKMSGSRPTTGKSGNTASRKQKRIQLSEVRFARVHSGVINGQAANATSPAVSTQRWKKLSTNTSTPRIKSKRYPRKHHGRKANSTVTKP